MTKRKVVLNLISSRIDYEITILSSCGIIKNKIIRSKFSKLCFCTKDCQITLLARYANETIHQTISLNNCICQSLNMGFAFSNFDRLEVLNLISLTDLNYGFPVADAVLNFK